MQVSQRAVMRSSRWGLMEVVQAAVQGGGVSAGLVEAAETGVVRQGRTVVVEEVREAAAWLQRGVVLRRKVWREGHRAGVLARTRMEVRV